MIVKLENDQLSVEINTFGAELSGIVRKRDGAEMLWNADPKFWKRSAPVLFPFVGGVKNKEYHFEGKAYPMGQHGVARDSEFALISIRQEEAWFAFSDTEETRKVYPFSFRLSLGYRLEGNRLTCLWRVENTGVEELFYSIGGHPAFMCPVEGRGKQTEYAISLDTDAENLSYGKLSSDGLLESEGHLLPLSLPEGKESAAEGKNGRRFLRISENLFDEDALIVEGGQAHRVGLTDPEGTEYLVVHFDAPLFGLWSPAGKGAPFVCIEPWYGRCDRVDFAGSLPEREYGQALGPGQEKEYSYVIEVL